MLAQPRSEASVHGNLERLGLAHQAGAVGPHQVVQALTFCGVQCPFLVPFEQVAQGFLEGFLRLRIGWDCSRWSRASNKEENTDIHGQFSRRTGFASKRLGSGLGPLGVGWRGGVAD